MPSLHLFQRKTSMSGDDLQPAALITVFVRFIQIFVLVVIVSIHVHREASRFLSLSSSHSGKENDNRRYEYFFGGDDVYPDNSLCNSAHYFPLLLVIYLALTTIHAVASVIIERRVYLISSIGTPIESYKRNQSLSKILQRYYIWGNIVGNVIVLTVGLVCCIGYTHNYYACRDSFQSRFVTSQPQQYSNLSFSLDSVEHFGGKIPIMNATFYNRKNQSSTRFWPSAWWIPLILLLVSQCTELIFSAVRLIALFLKEKAISFHPNTIDMESSESLRIHHSNHELVEAMWSRRIHSFFQWAARLTCYLFGGKELNRNLTGEYGDLARTLADFFEYGEVLDLTPTDLAVAFMMLQRVQRQRVLEARNEVVDGVRVVNNVQSNWSIRSNPGSFSTKNSRLSVPSGTHSSSSSLHTSANEEFKLDPVDNNAIPTSSLADPLARLHPTSTTPLTVASLKMLSEDRRDTNHWYESAPRRVLSRHDDRDRFALAEGARYARFALAIYTWILYVYMKPVTGLIDLCFLGCKDKCHGKRYIELGETHDGDDMSASDNPREVEHTEGDNCCNMHTNALLRHVGLDRCDLVYANFKNKYNQMPYCVIVDHSWQSVVVAIRGTLSLEDCVVDVLIDPEPLELVGREFGFDGENEFCHGGVLACAQFVHSDLEHHRILGDLLFGKNARFPQYKLRFVGHSLGAGCATLLGYFYRRQYPTLRVLSFSPPGGFITWRLALECKTFVTSFILDTELVPRLSIDSMEHLRSEVLDLFGRIRVSKFDALKSFVIGGVFCDRDEYYDPLFLEHKNRQMLHPPGYLDESADFFDRLNEFKVIQTRRKLMRGDIRAVRLFPPGQIIHFVRTGEKNSCNHNVERCLCCMSNAGYEYTPVWAENDDLNEIMISPTMFTDHFPNRVCMEIEQVAEEYGISFSRSENL